MNRNNGGKRKKREKGAKEKDEEGEREAKGLFGFQKMLTHHSSHITLDRKSVV